MKALEASASKISNPMADKNCATESLVLDSQGKVVLAGPGRPNEYALEADD